jgi:hypothetical protein
VILRACGHSLFLEGDEEYFVIAMGDMPGLAPLTEVKDIVE